MNFADKCNHIFSLLCCSNAEIARECGVNPSLVSRYRTGSRQPGEESEQLMRFCAGIAAYAEKKQLTEKLKRECPLPGIGKTEDELCAFLAEATGSTGGRVIKTKPFSNGMFGEKLDALMKMLNISNIRLAHALNIDASLVSRFRNGLRMPPKNSTLMNNLCGYIYRFAGQNGFDHELFGLLGMNPGSNKYDDAEIAASLARWLWVDNEAPHTGDIDSFLGKLDNLNRENMPAILSIQSFLQPDALKDSSVEYTGTDGLRKAVIRFLSTVALSEKKHVLRLFSNKKLDWLSADPVFMQKWTALMYAVLKNKNQIKIIHNVYRNLPEMLTGIEKWIPLYMSGLIEGYYCNNADIKFSNTLFVAPETAGIYGSFVTGTEDSGIYQYAGTPDRVRYFVKQFDALLAISQPLVQVFRKEKASDFQFCRAEIAKSEGTLKRLLLSPSLATMPAGLLEQMLRRADVGHDERNTILKEYEFSSRLFEKELKNGHVVEYVVFPDDEALSAGKVKLNLSDAFSGITVYYTPEEYSDHIAAVIKLLEDSNYDIHPLTVSPYENIQITVKENTGAIVLKNAPPATVFRFSHPLMCDAFSNYIDIIGQNSKLCISGKKELIQFLGKYRRN